MISVECIEEVVPFGRRVVDKHPKQVPLLCHDYLASIDILNLRTPCRELKTFGQFNLLFHGWFYCCCFAIDYSKRKVCGFSQFLDFLAIYSSRIFPFICINISRIFFVQEFKKVRL
jgi:hypothetical protein